MNQDTSVSKYVRFCKSLNDKGVLVQADELSDLIDPNKDSYASTYYYNQKQYDQFKETGTIRGIKDVVTDRIWFDFDSEKDVSLAQKDALTVIERLQKYGIKSNNIEVYFSGNRGFEVTVRFNRMLTPEQVQSLAINKFGKDLSTLDISLYDNSQILRLPFTRHQKSGLFKIPLDTTQLKKLNIDEIKKLAFSLDTAIEVETEQASPSEEFFYIDVPKKEEVKPKVSLGDLDLSRRPKHWKLYKWALLHAIGVKPDQRHEALLRVAATCRGLGYSEDITRAFCLTFDENFQRLTGKPAVEDLDTNILPSVFSEAWEGGQYSYKTDIWLQKYCESIGVVPNDIKDENPIRIDDIKDGFSNYVKHIEQNTIKTGIRILDEKMPITTGMVMGVVGSASSGKTALALTILKNTSRSNIPTVFASLDMHRNRLFEKLLYNITNLPRKELFEKIKRGETASIYKTLADDFKNIWFYDRSSPTVDNIRDYILKVDESSGRKTKLVLIDYFERIGGEKSDDTASSKEVAGKLQDLANDLDVCVIILVQPNKFALGGGPDTPIKSYTAIKGSSFLYQSMRSIISIWRPFFHPDFKENDDYMQMAILKNDLGEIGTYNFSWHGRTGKIEELTQEGEEELKRLLKEKDKIKNGDSDWE